MRRRLAAVPLPLCHRVALVIACAAAAPWTSGAAQPAPASAVERTKLAEDIWLFRVPSEVDRWTSSSSLVVINEGDVTVFDSNARPSSSRLVIAEIRKLTDKPVRTLINSHWHMDHWMGNEAYADAFPGLQIIATATTRDFMRRMPPPFFLDESGVARERARLDTTLRTGKRSDGTALTDSARRELLRDFAKDSAFAAELAAARHALPTLVYTDSLTFWSGGREFRLYSCTGDAAGSTVLYLPAERVLATGDVLVRQEDGRGAQPWTTNNFSIRAWLASLRRLDALDAATIVPGQGPALTDHAYLRLTIAMYASIIAQVDAAMERGTFLLPDVQAAVNLDDIRRQFTGGVPELDARFKAMSAALVRRALQEAKDGITG
jgi:cyclase